VRPLDRRRRCRRPVPPAGRRPVLKGLNRQPPTANTDVVWAGFNTQSSPWRVAADGTATRIGLPNGIEVRAVTDDARGILASFSDGRLVRINPSGTDVAVLGTAPVLQDAHGIAVTFDGILAAGTAGVTVLDPDTAATRWTVPLGGTGDMTLAVDGSAAWLAGDQEAAGGRLVPTAVATRHQRAAPVPLGDAMPSSPGRYVGRMPVRPQKRGGSAVRGRAPMKPRPPASVELATVEDHGLEDEATYRRLEFAIDLSGRSAESVEFEQCRFRNADLGRTSLSKAAFTDCLFENGNLANLRVEKSSMLRVRLSVLRMTGVHWIDGVLRDVAVSECRADLTSFRFSDFHNVTFDGCNLTRADFQNADVSGVQFTNCDLSGAQFSQAKMEGTRFVNCVLAGVGGVTSFAGAIVASQDLAGLSYALAAALGIRIEGGGDNG
jgi:uncharacterized protein YjbI with pentapeptide repeats